MFQNAHVSQQVWQTQAVQIFSDCEKENASQYIFSTKRRFKQDIVQTSKYQKKELNVPSRLHNTLREPKPLLICQLTKICVEK